MLSVTHADRYLKKREEKKKWLALNKSCCWKEFYFFRFGIENASIAFTQITIGQFFWKNYQKNKPIGNSSSSWCSWKDISSGRGLFFSFFLLRKSSHFQVNCNSESNQASARARRHLPAKKVFSVLFFPPEALSGRRGFSIASDLSLFFFSKEEKSKKIINFKEENTRSEKCAVFDCLQTAPASLVIFCISISLWQLS